MSHESQFESAGDSDPKETKHDGDRFDRADRGANRTEKAEKKSVNDLFSRPSREERACDANRDQRQSDLLGARDGRNNVCERATKTEGKREQDERQKGARDYLCDLLFDTSYKPAAEPVEHEPDRGFGERTLEWTGVDSFLSERPVGDWGDFLDQAKQAVSDFKNQQSEMIKESTTAEGEIVNQPGRDKYYHCMANCIGNSRGPGGEAASAAASAAKEVKDVAKVMMCKDWSYGAATRDSMRDQTANRIGRDAGRNGLRCEDACNSDRVRFTNFMFL